MEEIDELNDDLVDALNEILSTVMGGVSHKLSGTKLNFEDPQTVPGEKIKYENSDGFPWLKVPISLPEVGDFDLYIGMEETAG